MRSIKTIWGVEWPLPDTSDFVFFFFFILIIAVLFGGFWYLFRLNRKKNEEYQGFIFKMKQHGLSSTQILFLLAMKKDFSIKDYAQIVMEPAHLESYIPRYFQSLSGNREEGKSVKSAFSLCRDLAVMMEKLYNELTYREPLDSLSEVDIDTAICLYTTRDNAIIGKVLSAGESALTIRPIHDYNLLGTYDGGKINVYLWRSGDSEYTFESVMKRLDNGSIELYYPESFNRGKEVRRPYVDVLIPSRIISQFAGDYDPKILKTETGDTFLPAQMIKLNENEAVVRTDKQAVFKGEVTLDFKVGDFTMHSAVKVLSNQAAAVGPNESRKYIITLKFESLSEAAQQILKKFVASKIQNR